MCPKYLQQIPPEDWQRTPGSVKTLVEEMAQGIEQLKQQQAEVLALQQ